MTAMAVNGLPKPPLQPLPAEMSPTLIAERLEEFILSRWRLHWRDHGQLTGRWLGGPVTSGERMEMLAHLAHLALTVINPSGGWTCHLDVDHDDQPTMLLISDRRDTVEIEARLSPRAIRINGAAIPLEAEDAGRRVLEAVSEAIGAVFGASPGGRPKRRRRHDA